MTLLELSETSPESRNTISESMVRRNGSARSARRGMPFSLIGRLTRRLAVPESTAVTAVPSFRGNRIKLLFAVELIAVICVRFWRGKEVKDAIFNLCVCVFGFWVLLVYIFLLEIEGKGEIFEHQKTCPHVNRLWKLSWLWRFQTTTKVHLFLSISLYFFLFITCFEAMYIVLQWVLLLGLFSSVLARCDQGCSLAAAFSMITFLLN